jgi:hypothetical protein
VPGVLAGVGLEPPPQAASQAQASHARPLRMLRRQAVGAWIQRFVECKTGAVRMTSPRLTWLSVRLRPALSAVCRTARILLSARPLFLRMDRFSTAAGMIGLPCSDTAMTITTGLR